MSKDTEAVVETPTVPESQEEVVVEETPTEEAKAPTAAEVMAEASPLPKAEAVPLATFLDVKKDNKELREAIASLEKKIDANRATPVQVGDDLQALASEYELDPAFLSKLTNVLSTRAEQAAEAKVAPLKEKERQEKIEVAFKKAFDHALELAPEYRDIANADAIKALSLDPRNADKTFIEIIESVYGNAISGKRSIETTTPGGGKAPESLDFARAAKDPAYFSQIMADPKLKSEYNSSIVQRNRF